MKTKRVLRTVLVLAALVAAVLFRPLIAKALGTPTFTFSDTGIETTAPDDAYKIKNNTNLTISVPGTYKLTGSCSEGSISVAKEIDVTLILDNLTLTSATTAPVAVKSEANVTIHLTGTSILTDNEPQDSEDAEGACIKAKSGADLVFCGDGTLTCVANTKNAIKGAAQSSLTFNQTGTINVTGNASGFAASACAVNNGIAADGYVAINSGTFNIAAANDGIKSDPDVGNVEEGTETDTSSLGAVIISGGYINLYVDGDGIHADSILSMYGGTVMIKTMNGYNTSGTKYVTNNRTGSQYDFDPDTMSAKGLKAGGDRAEDQGITPIIIIDGGTIGINAADDAIHSDGNVSITGGYFQIGTGDDGVHAEETLTIGTANNAVARDPEMSILASYEGLEGTDVVINSGRIYVSAKDDGVNAAGGSQNGPDPFGPGGGWAPWGGNNNTSHSITVTGGSIYVLCDGDGFDSNGTLTLTGGVIIIFSMSSGDNSALDADGTRKIDGAYVFTGGARGIDGEAKSSWFGSNQKYKAVNSTYNSGTILAVKVNGSLFTNIKLPKRVTYVMYSAPNLAATPTIESTSTYVPCIAGTFSHNWDEGVVTLEPTESAKGIKTFTCADCGATETRSIAPLVHIDECAHEEVAPTTGFVASFAGEGASINVYYQKDVTTPDETGVTYAIARNGDTGEIDESGDGQINFTVVLDDGYTLTGVNVEGGYKNLKDISSDLGIANSYRVTKVTSNLTITIQTARCDHEGVTAEDITWAWDKGAATASFHCNNCDSDISVVADVTSVLTDANTITFTASAKVGANTFTNTTTAAPFTATFAGDEGVESVSVFYIQKNEVPDETNATSAVARDSKTGNPVISGDGQINFLIKLRGGYTLESVTATEGTYKNIKGPDETGTENLYRITKVTGDMTITITTAKEIITGWVRIGGDYYYYEADGTPRTNNWAYYWGTSSYYYFGADGKMVISDWVYYNKSWYYMGADGKPYVSKWLNYDGSWYFFDKSGKMLADSWVSYGGAWYYLGKNGVPLVESWVTYQGAYYYMGANGKAVVNDWVQYGGYWYYLNASGNPVVSDFITLNGIRYTFDSWGRCTGYTRVG